MVNQKDFICSPVKHGICYAIVGFLTIMLHQDLEIINLKASIHAISTNLKAADSSCRRIKDHRMHGRIVMLLEFRRSQEQARVVCLEQLGAK